MTQIITDNTLLVRGVAVLFKLQKLSTSFVGYVLCISTICGIKCYIATFISHCILRSGYVAHTPNMISILNCQWPFERYTCISSKVIHISYVIYHISYICIKPYLLGLCIDDRNKNTAALSGNTVEIPR